jgi:hypothetical protein
LKRAKIGIIIIYEGQNGNKKKYGAKLGYDTMLI